MWALRLYTKKVGTSSALCPAPSQPRLQQPSQPQAGKALAWGGAPEAPPPSSQASPRLAKHSLGGRPCGAVGALVVELILPHAGLLSHQRVVLLVGVGTAALGGGGHRWAGVCGRQVGAGQGVWSLPPAHHTRSWSAS